LLQAENETGSPEKSSRRARLYVLLCTPPMAAS
jgi:hypothetical protein